jgi:hypothetical protein
MRHELQIVPENLQIHSQNSINLAQLNAFSILWPGNRQDFQAGI